MISPLILGVVKGGKFFADNSELFNQAFFCHEGRRVEVSVKRHVKKRSLKQDRYYFGVVVAMIGEAIGEDDPLAIHEVLKHECNYYLAGDFEVRVPLSTKKLTTAEFEDYLERVRRWAAIFLSLYIPMPNETTN